MHTVVAIFTSQEAAEHAAARLGSLGIPREQLHFLMPEAPPPRSRRCPPPRRNSLAWGARLGVSSGAPWGLPEG